jgi:hypothetical protein
MLQAAGALIGGILGIALTIVTLSVSSGVVREYCLDVTASQATQSVVVDKHWTYIVWPPLMFSSLDPAGRCVRNSPLRQALDALGIWKLPLPEEQVRRHVLAQLRNTGTGG